MKNLNLFIPITKVDEEKRLVYGIATAEAPDQSGEICDYKTTVPYYKAWSDRIEKASEGKSKGNLRAMHASIAAGKVTQIEFNDEEKQIEVCAKVVDQDEWNKVIEGVYTGFSQGGRYVKTWKDGEYTRYTADPSEISLVDNPCLPTATFTLLRAGGAAEMRKFKTIEENIMTKKVAQVWQATDGSTYATKAEALTKNAEIEATAAAQPALDAAAQIEKVLEKKEFSDKDRENDADEGKALPDGSFPIENKEDLENAIKAVGRAKDEAEAKAHIIARAKALDATDMLPENWEGSTKDAEKAAPVDLKKFCGSEVFDANFAMDALTSIQCLYMNEMSQDGQTQDGQLADLAEVIARLKSFIASEIMENVGGKVPAADGDQLAMSAGDDLGKKGAAISAVTKGHIEKMMKSASDHADTMQECYKAMGMESNGSEDAGKSLSTGDLEKVTKLEDDNAALTKTITTLNNSMEKILARVKQLEEQPLPAKGTLYRVEKGHEVEESGKKPVEAPKSTNSVPARISPVEYRSQFYQ